MGCLMISVSFKRYFINRPPGRGVHWISCKSANLNDIRYQVRTFSETVRTFEDERVPNTITTLFLQE